MSLLSKKLKKPNFKLLGDRVAIVPDKVLDKTKAGVIIPVAFQDAQRTGTVIAVGPGQKDQPKIFMKVGNKVVYKENAGADIEYEEQSMRLVRGIDVVAVL